MTKWPTAKPVIKRKPLIRTKIYQRLEEPSGDFLSRAKLVAHHLHGYEVGMIYEDTNEWVEHYFRKDRENQDAEVRNLN